LTAASAISPSELSAPRSELARLCRQICLQRHDSPAAGAGTLDGELADALATVRAAHGDASVHEDDLLDLFRAEQLRVADASVLAEILAPKVAAYLRQHGLTTAAAPAASGDSPRPTSARPPLSASSTLPAAPAGPPNIADLLDGMLEQDRHDERTRRTGSRR
jgi:hypothetical protein